MAKSDDAFKRALKGKKIPPLTLDNKWHQLFTQTRPDKRLNRLADELNSLLQQQGNANEQMKGVRKLKRRLMQQIMENADEASSGNELAIRKTDESKRLFTECNEKIAEYEDSLLELPKEIDKVNKELMLLTMNICYDRLWENEQKIVEISEWVAKVREELKEKLVEKQEMEDANHELYAYMHDIFGPDVINLFDVKYKVKR